MTPMSAVTNPIFLLLCGGIICILLLAGGYVWFRNRPVLYNTTKNEAKIIHNAAFYAVTAGLNQNQTYTKKGQLRAPIAKKIEKKTFEYRKSFQSEDFHNQLLELDLINDEDKTYGKNLDAISYQLYQYVSEEKAQKALAKSDKETSKSENNKATAGNTADTTPDIEPVIETPIEPPQKAKAIKTPPKSIKALMRPITKDEPAFTDEDLNKKYFAIQLPNGRGISPKRFFNLQKNEPFDQPGVYIIHNETKRMYYVGQSVRLSSRLKDHFSGHGNPDVYADYKYGNKFRICWVFLDGSEFTDLNFMERYYIKQYNSFENGYNKTAGNKSAYKARLKRGEFKDVDDAAEFLVNAITHCAQEMEIPEAVIIKVLAKTYQTNVMPSQRSVLIVKLLNHILLKQNPMLQDVV